MVNVGLVILTSGTNAEPSGNASGKECFPGGEFSAERKNVTGLEEFAYCAAKSREHSSPGELKRNSFIS